MDLSCRQRLTSYHCLQHARRPGTHAAPGTYQHELLRQHADVKYHVRALTIISSDADVVKKCCRNDDVLWSSSRAAIVFNRAGLVCV